MVCTETHPRTGVSGGFALASPDGLGNWSFLGDGLPAVNKSDTCDVGFWDSTVGKYVLYIRLDAPLDPTSGKTLPDGTPNPGRRVTRCETADLGAWCPDGQRNRTAFFLDSHDPPSFDVYTNSASRYEGAGVLFFPSIYFHFRKSPNRGANLTKVPNDGLWETRFAVSRDGRDIHYAGARDFPNARYARAPFVSQGVNKCSFVGGINDAGGWCPVKPGSLTAAATSYDTSMVGIYPGALLSQNRDVVYLFKWGQPCTHHGCLASQATVSDVVGNNSGIELLVGALPNIAEAATPADFARGLSCSTARPFCRDRVERIRVSGPQDRGAVLHHATSHTPSLRVCRRSQRPEQRDRNGVCRVASRRVADSRLQPGGR